MSLRLATVEEQRARDALTYQAWGSSLTREQFLARERALRAHPWARTALHTWLWTGPAAEVLASCETFEVAGEVGGLRGRSFLVASVFVEDGLRGQGHAAAMLTALQQRLASEPNAQAVVLFSEVGVELYQRVGFFPVPSFDTWFDAHAEKPEGLTWLQAPLPTRRSPAPAAQALHLTLSEGQVDWHLERERFYATALSHRALPAHGARLGESTIGWTAYWRTGELQVLWLDAAEGDRLPLLRAAQWAAHQVSLPQVRVWESLPLQDVPGGRRARRDDEVAMFAPLVPGLSAWTHVERGLWA